MKFIKTWSFICGILMAFNFTSCSDDDTKESKDNVNNEGQTSGSILGTWREDWGDGPCDYTAYSFFEDGTGLFFDKGNGAERFTYTYNHQLVKIIYSEYQQEQLSVSKLTTNILVMDNSKYRKANLSYDMMILGSWLLHVNPQNTSENKTVVTFWADGEYEAYDYIGWSSNNSLGDLQGHYNGTWAISGNRLSIQGESKIVGEYVIEGLVVNGCRLVRASYPNEYPYLIGGWWQR